MRTCGCHSHNGLVLSPEGLAQRERKLDEVDAMDESRYLDKSGSVSALVEVEDDFDYDPRHIELNRHSALLQMEMF